MKKLIFAILFTLSISTLYANEASDVLKFKLTDTDGKSINITESDEGLIFEEHKGKAIFLVIFGHNCPPCKAEIPEFIELTKEQKDKLAIVAIEAQRYTSEQLGNFKEKNGINYSLVSGEENGGFIAYIAQRAQWRGAIPLLITLDKKGAVMDIMRGFHSKKKLEKMIVKLTK
jgi:peroxiredoxin